MNPSRSLFALLGFVLAAFGSAQVGTSSVAASGGSVAAEGSSGSTGWSGLAESARGATISYDGGPGSPPSSASKFASDPSTNAVVGTTYSYSSAGGGGAVYSHGESTVSTPSGGAPAYYEADWGSVAFEPSDSGSGASIGTFDPYDVRRSDVAGLGSTVDLYYQTSLMRTFAGTTTGVAPLSGQVATYAYRVYATSAVGGIQPILSVSFSSAAGLSLSYVGASNIQAYLIDPTRANDPTLTPDRRVAGVTPLSSTSVGALSQYFTSTGALTRDLEFGIFYRGLSVGMGSPSDVLLSWHTDSFNTVAPRPVPEPTSFAALGFAAWVIRRRPRS